ncbi:alpha/beta hydrolase [Actinokineospora sp. PR83]|uniref:alpha/beta hydrolase n=1 Tax=Actinokineospora sp. PR83 TaxID=2884908 RepID=UPI001F39C995|nr:alpha/beta hydrolase [Actinokineospora sp. PR83]MCG8915952.1 alpha/beta hydrolase [Actinokineospora sp. PR83]
MPLDPQVLRHRELRAENGVVPLYELTLAEARAEDLRSIQDNEGAREVVAEVGEREIAGPGGGIRLRVYRPGAGVLPVLVYFFGGGWTLGTIETADAICRRLANAAGCVVVSVGYRLAPEHRFPAAVHDCVAATAWVGEHAGELGVDAGRVAVGGDSAGGNLAAAVTLVARERGVKLVHQLLVYPNTEYRADTASLRESTDRYLFNRDSVAWYWGHYLASPEDGENPLASPLKEPDLSGLPPATVITAEYDPLRDEGERYAERLRDAGVAVDLTRYDGMAHGFFAMFGTVDAAGRAVRAAADRLREAFAADAG